MTLLTLSLKSEKDGFCGFGDLRLGDSGLFVKTKTPNSGGGNWGSQSPTGGVTGPATNPVPGSVWRGVSDVGSRGL